VASRKQAAKNPPRKERTAPSRAVGYVRVSTAAQAEKGLSIDAQRASIEKYCEMHGIVLVGVEVDDGYTGKNLDRPAAQRAIEALKSGAADSLVVLKLDRLTRSTRDLYGLIEDVFEPLGASFLSVHERIDTSSASGRVLVAMLGVLAQFEREQTAERVKLALAHLKANGVALGQLAYGRRRQRQDGAKHADVVPSPDELESIGLALDLHRSGKSLRGVAKALDDAGRRPRRASRWSPSSVLSALAAARAATPRRPWSSIDGGRIVFASALATHAESPNSEKRRRDTVRKKMQVKNAIAAVLLANRDAPPEMPVDVTITLVQGPRGATWDGDNAVGRAKGIRDEVARWLGVDDREGRGVSTWTVRVERGKEPAARVEIAPSVQP